MKNIFIKFISVSCLVFAALVGNAQDLNTHYSYQLNWFNINPAYTGETEGIKTILNQKAQWIGLEGSPVNSMVGLHTNVKDNMGVGGKIIYEKRGLLANFSSEFNYAYKIKFDDTKKLSFGLSIGLLQAYLDQSDLFNDNYTDLTDPLITDNYVNTMNVLTSFGALYKDNNMEVGLSAPHLATTGSGLSDHLILMAKYRIEASSKFSISPSIVAQSLSYSPEQLDIGVKFEYDSLVWFQFIYKTSGNIVPAIGFNVQKFNFGYAYNVNNKPLKVISSGSHDVFISFTFDKRKREDRLGKDRSKHLKSILSNLNSIEHSGSSSELDKEVKELQNELSGLVDKMKNNDFTDEDEKRMNEIAVRINKIKQQ